MAVSASSAADPTECAKRNSVAWCILNAAGYADGASDVSQKRVDEYMAKIIPSVQFGAKLDAGALVIAGLDAAKLTTPVPGISRGTSIGMALLGAVLSGRKPGEMVQMFMLMPDSAVLEGDPGKTAEAAYVDALRRYLEAESSELVETLRKPTFGAAWTERHYLMKGGPRCADVGCLATASFFHSDSRKKVPREMVADPLWAGSSTVYVWDRFYADAQPHVRLVSDEKYKEGLGKEEYLNFIKLLPPWFYLYLPGEVNLLVNSERVLPLAK